MYKYTYMYRECVCMFCHIFIIPVLALKKLAYRRTMDYL